METNETPVNTSNIRPLGVDVLVKLPPVVTKTAGGILIPEQTQVVERQASQKGIIVAMGPLAFTDEDNIPIPYSPEVGSTVGFARYGGLIFKGDDGDEYRLMKDGDIRAVISG